MGPYTPGSTVPCENSGMSQMDIDPNSGDQPMEVSETETEIIGPGDGDSASLDANDLALPDFRERLRSSYLNNGLCPTDMKVMAKDKMFRVHKHVFMMTSPDFMSLTSRAMKETEKLRLLEEVSVKLPIEPDIFRVILKFMYIGEVNHPNIIFTGIDQALMVLETSVVFNIFELKKQMIEKVVSLMTRDNVLKILTLARRFSQGSPEFVELEEKALAMILENGEQVIGSNDFNSLGAYDVCRILSSDDLKVVSEIRVFNAAMRWVDAKVETEGSSENAAKCYFAQLKECVRFALMSIEELGIAAVHDRLLDPLYLYEVFKFVSLPSSMKNLASTKFDTKPRKHSLVKVAVAPIIAHLKPNVQSEEMSTSPNSTSTEIIVNDAMPPPATPSCLTNGRKKRRLSGGTTVSFAVTASVMGGDTTITLKNSSDSDDEEMFYKPIRRSNAVYQSFDDLYRKEARRDDKPEVSAFTYANITLEHLYTPAFYKNCRKLDFDFKLKFITNGPQESRTKRFMEFLSHFDLLRHLAAYDTKGIRDLTYEDITTTGQNVHIRFNGVTFFKIHHEMKVQIEGCDETDSDAEAPSEHGSEVVLNYIHESSKILSQPSLKVVKLAISNCEFSVKALKDRTRYLKTLNLYRCWGEYSIDELLSTFPNLEELYCWKHKPNILGCKTSTLTAVPALNLSSLASKPNLKKLVLFRVVIQIPTRCQSIVSNITELVLDTCTLSTGRLIEVFAQSFREIFPRLSRLGIKDSDYTNNTIPGNCAISYIINQAFHIETLQWLKVHGMKWGSAGEVGEVFDSLSEDGKLLERMKEYGLKSTDEKPRNFELSKDQRGRSVIWNLKVLGDPEKESVDVDGGAWSSMDQQEHEWYRLDNFYDSYETYEDYFLNDADHFPKPRLWV